MERIMVRLDFLGPADGSAYESYDPGSGRTRRGVGAFISVHIDGALVLEGRADPDSLDSAAEAIESMTLGMPYVHWRRDDGSSPDLTREGWGLRWLEHVVRNLREGISKDLGDAVDRLAARKNELERYK